jgi:hypothetical protein
MVNSTFMRQKFFYTSFFFAFIQEGNKKAQAKNLGLAS